LAVAFEEGGSSTRYNVRRALLALFIVGAAATAASAQRSDLTIDAPSALEPIARRIREMDPMPLEKALESAGLPAPPRVRIVLIAGDDPRIHRLPEWIVGFASGTEDVVILPSRVGSYPYGSIESVVRHEIVHLALNTRAGGELLPRWFHEGVAVTVESGWGSRDQVRLLLAALERPSMADLSRLFASDMYPTPRRRTSPPRSWTTCGGGTKCDARRDCRSGGGRSIVRDGVPHCHRRACGGRCGARGPVIAG
jgi:hypothetical protein